MNLLFVCSRNQWRSPTAEAIYKDYPNCHVRSAGTEPSARIKVSEKLVRWADLIFAMEKRHKQRLIERFGDALADKPIIVLDIADDYAFMDEELVDSIQRAVEPYLDDAE